MAKHNMICTEICEDCIHSDIDKTDILLKFHCSAKNKDYYFGQYVPCTFMEKRKRGATKTQKQG